MSVSRIVISLWRRLNLYFFNVESLESNLIWCYISETNVNCCVINLRSCMNLLNRMWAQARKVQQGSKISSSFEMFCSFNGGKRTGNEKNHGSLSIRSLVESFSRMMFQRVWGQMSGRWIRERQYLRFYCRHIQAKDQALAEMRATACAQMIHKEEVQAILWVSHQGLISNELCTGM